MTRSDTSSPSAPAASACVGFALSHALKPDYMCRGPKNREWLWRPPRRLISACHWQRCTTPDCPYRVHEEASFGGYCCKQCHFVHVRGPGKCKGPQHGGRCTQQQGSHLSLQALAKPPLKPQAGVRSPHEAAEETVGRSQSATAAEAESGTPGAAPKT